MCFGGRGFFSSIYFSVLRYNFSGSSALSPYALCVFIPVVDLVAPERVNGKIVHGSGCTAFWPGSHRYPACLHMGSAAASTLEAVINHHSMSAFDECLTLMYVYIHQIFSNIFTVISFEVCQAYSIHMSYCGSSLQELPGVFIYFSSCFQRTFWTDETARETH